MTNKDPNLMPDNEFEELLQSSLPDQPPDEIAKQVTPFRKAARRCLAGFALTAITLNFFGLQYILPTLGLALMLLGFRALCRENTGFAACYAVAIPRLLLQLAVLFLNATVYREILDYQVQYTLDLIGAALGVVTAACFWRGITQTQEKAGVHQSYSASGTLVIWYLVLFLLALFQFDSPLIALLMLIFFFAILYCLFKLLRSIDQVGYAIRPAPVRISDRWLIVCLAALLTVGLACSYLFFGRYPMEWAPVPAEEHAAVQETKAQLRALGFPEEVLNDLSAEDIASCAGATEVVVEAQSYAGNEDYPYGDSGNQNITITGVAVRVPDEYDTWRYFHHFRWFEGPGFRGTEAMRVTLDEACILAEIPTDPGSSSYTLSEFTGRVLCSKGGQTYTAPFYSLERPNYNRSAIANFSLHGGGSEHRGYITYAAFVNDRDRIIISSWFDYVHQKSWAQYPVSTADEPLGEWTFSKNGFTVITDPLQVDLEETKEVS